MNLLKNIFISFLLIGLGSCSFEEPMLIENQESSYPDFRSSDPFIENNYLVFKNDSVFFSISELISEMNDEEYLNWLSKFDIKTQRSELINFNSKSKQDGFSNENLDTNQAHTFHKSVEFDSAYNISTKKSPFKTLSSSINEFGVVKVGNDILYFDDTKFIRVKNGDLSKLEKAKRLTKSDIEEGIIISEIQVSSSVARTADVNDNNVYSFGGYISLPGKGLILDSKVPRYYWVRLKYSFIVWDTSGGYVTWLCLFQLQCQGVMFDGNLQRALVTDMKANISNLTFTYWGPGKDVNITKPPFTFDTYYNTDRLNINLFNQLTIKSEPWRYPTYYRPRLQFKYDLINNFDGLIASQNVDIIFDASYK